MKIITTEAGDPSIRVLKVGTCQSLSNKSKLTYEIGCDAAEALHVHISKNSGTGYFSTDWVRWDDLLRVLDKNAGMPITSFTLHPLFQQRSVNTAGFLLAALRNEGLMQLMEAKRRCHECRDATAFLAEIAALMSSPTAPGKAAKAVKEAPAKKIAPKARSTKS